MGTQSGLGIKLEAKTTVANNYALASSIGAASRKNLYRQVSNTLIIVTFTSQPIFVMEFELMNRLSIITVSEVLRMRVRFLNFCNMAR